MKEKDNAYMEFVLDCVSLLTASLFILSFLFSFPDNPLHRGLRRRRPQDVEGEDGGLGLRTTRNLILRTSSGELTTKHYAVSRPPKSVDPEVLRSSEISISFGLINCNNMFGRVMTNKK